MLVSKNADNNWTYNVTNQLLRNFLWSYSSFERIIAMLASMTYIIDLDAYAGEWKIVSISLWWILGFCILHMIGLIVIQKYICILMLMTTYECSFFWNTHIFTHIFIIEIAFALHWNYKTKQKKKPCI